MLGELNKEEIEDLLNTQLIGRIGCHADGVTYIVPVNFVYENPYIYAHSAKGLKIDNMRKNPEVCFEVDKIESLFIWQSVVCWGTFEEITDISGSEQAMQKIIRSIEPYLAKTEDAHPSHGILDQTSEIGSTKELIIYRINLTKKTGRFEKREYGAGYSQERA
jgi:nitroimidazol reductase NimA-like FMN-containing flavoprotein (pyridoxamine 5'-phosphate oxidase superfamily)